MTGPAQSILETLRHRSVLVTTSAGRAISDVITEAIRCWRRGHPGGFLFHHRTRPGRDSGPHIAGILLRSLRSASGRNRKCPFALPLPFEGEALADKLLVELCSITAGRTALIVLEGLEDCLDAGRDPFLAWLPVPPPGIRYLLVLDEESQQARKLSERARIATFPLSPGEALESPTVDGKRDHAMPVTSGDPDPRTYLSRIIPKDKGSD